MNGICRRDRSLLERIMPGLHNLSIKKKLTLIIMATSSMVLVLSSFAYLITETVSFRRGTIAQMTSLSSILATNARIPLQFRDQKGLEEILSGLSHEPNICMALIFNQSDFVLARYIRSEETFLELAVVNDLDRTVLSHAVQNGKNAYIFRLSHLDMVSPIFDRGKKIGTVYLRSDLTTFYQHLLRFSSGALAVMAFSVLLAYLIGFRLQQWVSRPLLTLVSQMAAVKESGDFNIRAEANSGDETDILAEGFNSMLTGLQERDEELQHHRRSLEKLVADRTKELEHANISLQTANQELEVARKAADQANEAKSLFLANMSHEIRTPMIGVLGMSELLLKSGLNERQKRMAETAYNSGESLLSLLNDILDFSKIESGKIELEEIPFDLWDAVEEPVALLAEKAFSKGVELICTIPPGTPREVVGDPARLRQVVLNLISNAIKFTEQGEVEVRLERQRGKISLEVRDTGIGIDAEAQKRIFDSFSQADNSTSRYFGGTGLGLAIVKQLTELMGGSIHLQSAPEQGATFRCTFNFKTHRRRKDCSALPQVPRTVIVAEPNRTVCQSLLPHLEAAGIRAIGSHTAAKFLEIVTSIKPLPMVLISSEFPGMANEDLLKTMSSLSDESDLKIGILSPPCGRALDLPGIETLYKPFLPSRFLDFLEKLRKLDSQKTVLVETSPVELHHPSPGNRATRILLAEDNPSTQRLVRFILEQSGYQVDTAATGEEVLRLTERTAYSLIFMDVQMPRMDGYETTEKLRRAGVNVPVVALTANNQIEKCRATEMDDYLYKPFKQRELLLVLEKWLDEGRISLSG